MLTDSSILQFGNKHKGKKLADVPDSYLLWIYENLNLPLDLKQYIESNLDAIKHNTKTKR